MGVDADGDFVVAWQSTGQDGSGYGVFARRFNAAGITLGSELQVNTYTTGNQDSPVIDLDEDGDFVIAWDSAHDGSDLGVFGQRFNSLAVRQGPEFQANDYVTGAQSDPAVGVDGNDFVIAWTSAGQDGDGPGIFTRRFDGTGAPQGTEMQVNTTTVGEQAFPAVRSNSDGDFVVAWTSRFQDGSGYGVFGQRFDVPSVLDIDGNGQLTALTDGLLMLRFLFGFTGSTLTGGAVGPNCTRCDSATILPYLQSLT